MTISNNNFNAARQILIVAGSKTAKNAHPKHTNKNGSPDSHGQSLLSEARDEFRQIDRSETHHKSRMTKKHYDAIHQAAEKMSIQHWD